MADVVETRSTFDSMLKYDYAPEVTTLTGKKVKLLTLIDTKIGKRNAGGKSFVQALELDSMGSVGSRADNGAFPDALPGNWTNTSVPVYYHYFSMTVSGALLWTSDSDKFAFAEAWQRELVVKMRAWQQNLNRMLNGDGNGYLAQVDGSTSGVYVTVDNAYGVSGFNNSAVNGGRFFTPNMLVDFYTGSTIRDSGGVRITTVTPGSFPSTSAILTTSGTISSVADGDYVHVSGSYGYEMPGLRGCIDDGTVSATFQGVTVASYPEFKSVVKYGSTPGTAEAWSTSRMSDFVDEIETYNGGQVDWLFSSPSVYLTAAETMRQEGMIINSRKLDTGWDVMTFNGHDWYKDPYCMDYIYAIDNSAINILEAAPQGWIEDGGNIMRLVPGYHRYTANWGWAANVCMGYRARCGKMEDISVTVNKI